MDENRVKVIDIKDLSDETLKKISKFNAYDCDKVVIKINSNITMEDIEKRVLELNKICYNIINLLCCQDDFPMYSKEYDNIWTCVDINNEGEIEAVTHNSEIISGIINMLINSLINEDLLLGIEDYISDKFDTIYAFREKYGHGRRYFNFNYDIEEINLK